MSNHSNYGSYTLFTASNPTIEQLKDRRAECVRMALVTYRMAHTRHPKDIQSRDYWAAQCRYWTDQAYHAHGELIMWKGNSDMSMDYRTREEIIAHEVSMLQQSGQIDLIIEAIDDGATVESCAHDLVTICGWDVDEIILRVAIERALSQQ